MSSVLRSLAAFAFVSALALAAAPGCSQQGEGERCDSTKNGDLDCDSGLTCIRKDKLLEQITDRCCPAEGSESDKRCTRSVPVSMGTAGSTSTAGTTSTAGAAGTPNDNEGGTPSTAGSTSEGGTPSTAGAPAEPTAGTPAADTAGQGGGG